MTLCIISLFNCENLVFAERAAIAAGDDLRGLGMCHQQAF